MKLQSSLIAALFLLGCGSGESTPDAPAEGHEHSESSDGHDHDGATEHHQKAAKDEPKAGFDSLLAAGNPRDVDGWRLFGADFTLTDSVAAAAVLASAADHDGKVVRMEGTVADVCNKMGCWLVVQAGEETIRVTMKEHAFGIDRDCAGKTASLEGVLQSKDVDPETAAHYESESDNPDAMPEKGKTRVWEIIASTVALKSV
jgi:hypothetical protein